MKLRFTILLIFCYFTVKTQNANFSQFYNNALYLNPAFNGTTSLFRLSTGYRRDNLGFAGLQTNLLSFEYSLVHTLSSLGIYYLNSRSHKGAFQRQEFVFIYAYSLRFFNGWQLNLAFQTNYLNHTVNFNRLTLEQVEILDGLNSNHFGIGGGFLLFNRAWWFGLTTKNIYISQINNNPNKLPLYLSLHLGYQYLYQFGRKRITVEPALLFQYQNTQYQNDLGVNWSYNNIIIGTWFRGFYNINSSNFDIDSIIGLVGFHIKSLQIIYSYDFKINPLGRNFAGLHEISLIFSKEKKVKKRLPCPIYF